MLLAVVGTGSRSAVVRNEGGDGLPWTALSIYPVSAVAIFSTSVDCASRGMPLGAAVSSQQRHIIRYVTLPRSDYFRDERIAAVSSTRFFALSRNLVPDTASGLSPPFSIISALIGLDCAVVPHCGFSGDKSTGVQQ